MHAPRFALVAILTAFVSMIGAQSALALPIVNGSLTGPIANGYLGPFPPVPPGWSIVVGSPDTMDENNSSGVPGLLAFAATPSPSPDGGTWVGFSSFGSSIRETFGQTIGGFTIGTVYSVSWYQANFGYIPGYTNPDVVEVLVDSVVVGNGSLAPLAPGWTSESVQFTATAVSHELSFRPGGDVDGSYLSADGISISAVPEPNTALLLSLGLVGLSARRRALRD
jgi:hypothetical protein